jgi:hypothetical protein
MNSITAVLELKDEREARKNPQGLQTTFEYLHDFQEHVTFEIAHYGWGPADEQR